MEIHERQGATDQGLEDSIAPLASFLFAAVFRLGPSPKELVFFLGELDMAHFFSCVKQ